MNIYPTPATSHVALAGAAMVAAGVASHRPPLVAFGSAVLVAVALGRALSLVSTARLRRAGFEMTWSEETRVVVVARGDLATVILELKNRSQERVRVVGLRAVASSFLEVTLSSEALDLPPETRLELEAHVTGRRVGNWGLHGLALELRGLPLGGDGLYEVPLVFSNPLGVSVKPAPLTSFLRSPRGGLSGRLTEAGRATRSLGHGDELRELREHVAGDPSNRIAWRASARRGRLMVRQMERHERDVVWLVLDASVEGWAGTPGAAPLDHAVEALASLAARHLSRGDSVGLVTLAARPRSWVPLGKGRPQAAFIAEALAECSSMVDADRTELDETDIARRVAEHLRPLARDVEAHRPTFTLDDLAKAADAIRRRAPFAAAVPFAATDRDRTLRHYLACFGLETPPRPEGERPRTEVELARTLQQIAREKPRPSLVHVSAAAPRNVTLLAPALRALRGQRTSVRWMLPEPASSVGAHAGSERPSPLQTSVETAVRIRAEAERARAIATLRALGVRPS